MLQYEIEYGSINVRWLFANMLPHLPFPGTEAFSTLVRELRPLGVTPNNIIVETPTFSLGDVALQIVLLNRVATLRITYSAIEMAANDPAPEQVIQFAKIFEAAMASVKLIDEGVEQGAGTVRVGLQLKITGEDVNEYLRRRISPQVDTEKLIPDALAFKLNLDEITKLAETRLVVAKSVSQENGLYVEISYTGGSGKVGEPVSFMQKLTEHYQNILAVLELERAPESAQE